MLRGSRIAGSLILAALVCVCAAAPSAYADHEGPERAVDGRYVVVLSVLPQEEDGLTMLTFFLRDMRSGKALTQRTVSGSVVVADARTGEIISGEDGFSTRDGRAMMMAAFPKDGLYEVAMSFRIDGSPEIFRPEPWEIWVKGKARGERPALGLSEGLGIALVAGAALLLAVSILQKKRV